MADDSLLVLARDVRGKTLKLLEGLSDADARFAAPGLKNSILWHAGHALILMEHLVVAPLTGDRPSDPPGYFETFSWKSDPATVTTWPSLEEVRARLREQLARLLRLLESADPAALSRVLDPTRGRRVRDLMVHGLHDEANHQGEMWLLRKMLGIRRGD
jgi:hypothetical protein